MRDALLVPRNELLATLHKQKHHFFECGRVEEVKQIRQALPANKRSVSIESMGNHRAAESSRQKLRNPLDTDEDIKHQERTAFGNLYLVFASLPSKAHTIETRRHPPH